MFTRPSDMWSGWMGVGLDVGSRRESVAMVVGPHSSWVMKFTISKSTLATSWLLRTATVEGRQPACVTTFSGTSMQVLENCAERSEIVRIFNEAREKRVKASSKELSRIMLV